MSPDFLTRCRQQLEHLECPWINQATDLELENWLFKPGPLHHKVLLWALCQIDPQVRDRRALKTEQTKEEEIVKLFVSIGLSLLSEADVILGLASRDNQETFWDKILNQLQILHNAEDKENEERNYNSACQFVSKFSSSTEFWSFLENEPNLLPPDVVLPPVQMTLEQLRKQLEETEEELINLIHEHESQLDSESSSTFHSLGRSISHHTNSASGTPNGEKDNKVMNERIITERNKIDKSFKKFKEEVAAFIEKSPPNPVGERLAQMVVLLEGKFNEFAQFFKNREALDRLSGAILKRRLPENASTTEDTLCNFISEIGQQLAGITSVLKPDPNLLE